MSFLRIVFLSFVFFALPARAADNATELGRAQELVAKKDFDAAIKIITPIAAGGNTLAQYYLATLYEGAYGYKPPRLGEARMWLERAADGGLMQAQATLGDNHYDGRGVPQDYALALKYYRLSADQGFGPPQNTLGEMYELGRGVPADPATALIYYKQAAANGLALAQVNAGRMYATGSGTTKDDAAAVKYFLMAAHQKNAAAAIWLGSAYETGAGVNRDLVQAYMWTQLAQKHANLRASPANFQDGMDIILDNLRADMTKEQVELAETLVKNWMPETDAKRVP